MSLAGQEENPRPTGPSPAPRFAFFYAAVFLALGVYLPFWPIWLESLRFPAEQIGLILGISNWVKIASNPVIGHFADRRFSARLTLIFLSLASTVTFAAFWLTGSFWIVLALQVLSAVVTHGIIPLGEAEAIQSARSGRLDYGRVRLWGSCAFIAGSLGAGFLVEAEGAGWVLWLMVGSMALTTLASTGLPHEAKARETLLPAAPSAPLAALLFSRRFLLLFCGAGLMQGSHAFYYGFSAIAWTANGLSERQVAWLWTTGVLAEIAFFFASAGILRRTGPLGLLLLAGACGVVRWSLSGATTDANWLFAIQLLHAGTFAAAHLGALHFIGAHAPEGRRATLQMIYTAAGTGLALGAMMLLSGHLYEAIGYHGFTGMAAASAVGSILILFLARTDGPRRATATS